MTFNDQREFDRNVEKLIAKKAILYGHPNIVPLESKKGVMV